MSVAINDIIRLKVYCQLPQQIGINVFHFRVAAIAGTSQTEVQIANFISTQLSTLYKNVLTSAATYRGVGVQVIRPVLGLEWFSANGQGVGLVAGDPLPKQVTGIISWKTNVAGPRGRGRSYIPFPGEASNDADITPSVAYFNNLAAIATIMLPGFVVIGGINSATLEFVLNHRASSTVDLIITGGPRDRWATQRRRGDYGRTNVSPI